MPEGPDVLAQPELVFELRYLPAQLVELVFFGLFYMLYCLFALVVLLNLLIAMLGFTFSSVQDDAVLQWRLLYARNVLRMESLASVFAEKPFNWWSLHGGELMGDRYFVFSRTYNSVSDGADKVMLVGLEWEDEDVPNDPHLDLMAQKIQQSWMKKRLRTVIKGARNKRESAGAMCTASAKNLLARCAVPSGMKAATAGREKSERPRAMVWSAARAGIDTSSKDESRGESPTAVAGHACPPPPRMSTTDSKRVKCNFDSPRCSATIGDASADGNVRV